MNALGFMFDTSAATIALLKHDHRAAAAIGRIITQTSPSYAMGYKPLLAALGHLGQARDAGPLLRRLLTLEPGFTTGRFIESYPLVRLADREHFAAGLRLAGAP